MQCIRLADNISKKIMDLTRNQVVKWQTSPVSVFKLRHCGPKTFFGTSRSHLGLEWKLNVLSRLSLESLGKWNVSVSSGSWGFNVLVSSRLESLKKWNVSVSSRSWKLTISVSSRSCDFPGFWTEFMQPSEVADRQCRNRIPMSWINDRHSYNSHHLCQEDHPTPETSVPTTARMSLEICRVYDRRASSCRAS